MFIASTKTLTWTHLTPGVLLALLTTHQAVKQTVSLVVRKNSCLSEPFADFIEVKNVSGDYRIGVYASKCKQIRPMPNHVPTSPAERRLNVGTELTIDYGEEFFNYPPHLPPSEGPREVEGNATQNKDTVRRKGAAIINPLVQ